ncbi:uncharacterized protein LOC105846597 [Hydra vulgaris]|uniref:uncharacterized protein LOC105846597 n=1 Tax=Hydra vulgaris TaxID=6087 RepID=UPI0032EA5929
MVSKLSQVMISNNGIIIISKRYHNITNFFHKSFKRNFFFLLKFVVCALHTGHIAIIPRPWLYKVCGIWKCRWTSSFEKTKNYSIFNPNWREYEITKIYAKTDAFNKAENIQADQSGKSDGSAVTLTDVENSITSATIPLGATPYKKRLRTLPNIDNSSEEFGKKIMKIRTRNSSPVYKDYSESDDSEQSDCSKNSQQIKLKSLPNFPLLLKENQPTASLMTMKDKESLQSVNANEVKVSSTIMQPRHEARSLELTNFELSDISEQDDLNLKDSSVNDDDSLQSLLKKLHVITLKSYQSIKELTLRVCRIEDDLCKMKLSLVGNIAEDNQDQMFVMEQYKTSDTFQNFCKMLEEDSVFRKLVIKFMIINYGQKSIWPCVRSILRASLSDNLMTLFNCTGSRGQIILI